MKSKLVNNFGNDQVKMQKKLQEVQAKMQAKADEIESMEFSGKSGGGAVEVVAKGDKSIVKINVVDESVYEDRVMLLDLIVSASNKALSEVDQFTDVEIAKITDGIPIPGLN